MIKKTLKSLKKQIASPDYSSMDLKAVTNSFNRTSDDINSYSSSVDNVMKLLQDGNTDDAQIQMNGVVLQNLMSLSTDFMKLSSDVNKVNAASMQHMRQIQQACITVSIISLVLFIIFTVFNFILMYRIRTVVSPMDDAIRNNYEEICHLQTIRDSLLPRLISGELDVSDIDL